MMVIKHFRTSMILMAFLLGGQLMAQEAQPATNADIDMRQARILLNFGREDIVREDLRMSEDEGSLFWPVYDLYQSDLQVVRDQYSDLLTAYLAAYRAGTVTEEMAEQVIDDYLTIQGEILKIKEKYLKDFRKSLPARKAARFYQLENKIELELEAQLSQIIPLIDPV
jgi:hypothetical protein